MLSSLTGDITELTPEGLVTVQVGPIALDALVPKSFLGRLSRGATVTFATHLQVSEDALALYAFASTADRAFFRKLLTVTGIGPKSALAILALEPDAVRQAIVAHDLDTLGRIPGLGKKRAQRLLLELANVLKEDDAPATKKRVAKEVKHPLASALEPALEKLGYTPAEVNAMIAELPEDIDDPATALQHVIKHAR